MLGALVQLLPREGGGLGRVGARESQAQVGGQEMGVETNDVDRVWGRGRWHSGEGGGGSSGEREGEAAQRSKREV